MCVTAHDGAALHGVLGQLRSLGLELISVRELTKPPHTTHNKGNTDDCI
jgi:hypothetical protein